MDQQGVERIADRRPAHFGVERDLACFLCIGIRVYIGMADARARLDDRHRRVLDAEVDQVRAAARNHHVNQPSCPQQRRDALPVGRFDQLDDACGQPHLGHHPAKHSRQRQVGVDGVAAAPQHDGVARLHGQAGDVYGHVRPRLIDDANHAERHSLPAYLDATLDRPHLDDFANRIGQRRHVADIGGDGL